MSVHICIALGHARGSAFGTVTSLDAANIGQWKKRCEQVGVKHVELYKLCAVYLPLKLWHLGYHSMTYFVVHPLDCGRIMSEEQP